jgi:excisionase family DNA binding protein
MSASPERPAQPPPGRENGSAGRCYCGIAEAARYLDVSPKTIRKAIANGTLPAYRWGPRVLKVKLADLDSLFT